MVLLGAPSRRRLGSLCGHVRPDARPRPRPAPAPAAATPPLGVAGVAHLARCTADVPGLARFYCDVLGFRRLERPDFPFDGVWLRSGDFMIHIIEAPGTGNNTFASPEDLDARHGAPPSKRDKPFALARGPHLALYVPDISAAEELLISHGVDYAKYDHGAKADKNAFSAQMNALPQIWFYDPDGNGVELAQLPAAADLFPPDQLEPQ